jgi:integrase
MAYFKRRKKGEPKTIPLNAEAQRAIQEQLRKFREKFGREAGPEDPIFFDPDADTPQPISKAGLDEMTGQILSAAGKSGIRPELIYAMRKTGRIVTESNQQLLTDDELHEWQDAIEEYLALVDKQQGRKQ